MPRSVQRGPRSPTDPAKPASQGRDQGREPSERGGPDLGGPPMLRVIRGEGGVGPQLRAVPPSAAAAQLEGSKAYMKVGL